MKRAIESKTPEIPVTKQRKKSAQKSAEPAQEKKTAKQPKIKAAVSTPSLSTTKKATSVKEKAPPKSLQIKQKAAAGKIEKPALQPDAKSIASTKKASKTASAKTGIIASLEPVIKKVAASTSKIANQQTAIKKPELKHEKAVSPTKQTTLKNKAEKEISTNKIIKKSSKSAEVKIVLKDLKKKDKNLAKESKSTTAKKQPVEKQPKTSDKLRSKKPKLNEKVAKKDIVKTLKVEETRQISPDVKPVKKKIKPLGSAVVRGKSGRYDFEIFPLDAEIKDGSAIYVISKRITDKRGRGHHKFVCIGQTESLIGDLKKHKKDKCIKRHNANVVCLLREENEQNRLKIETDLRAAHSIFCNQK